MPARGLRSAGKDLRGQGKGTYPLAAPDRLAVVRVPRRAVAALGLPVPAAAALAAARSELRHQRVALPEPGAVQRQHQHRQQRRAHGQHGPRAQHHPAAGRGLAFDLCICLEGKRSPGPSSIDGEGVFAARASLDGGLGDLERAPRCTAAVRAGGSLGHERSSPGGLGNGLVVVEEPLDMQRLRTAPRRQRPQSRLRVDQGGLMVDIACLRPVGVAAPKCVAPSAVWGESFEKACRLLF